MKSKLLYLATLLLFVGIMPVSAANETIRVSTRQTDLVMKVGGDGRLYQVYLGEKLVHEQDVDALPVKIYAMGDAAAPKSGWDVYSCHGNEDYFEPALSIVHADGNRATYLYYKNHSIVSEEGGKAIHTTVSLADDVYPVSVKLHYVAYQEENIIKTWTEISHEEKNPVCLMQYYSAMLYFSNLNYYLTEFASDWAAEVQMQSQPLKVGKKIVDTKLGSRANLFAQPFFEVGLDAPVGEHQGTVLMGTIAWVGNWRYTLEVDNLGTLRVLPGINPYQSDYMLKKGEVFRTPEFIFTLSQNGTSAGSRSFHDWARRYQVKDGMGNRMSLLNNWENTRFDFNQEKLAGFMKEANRLGVDLFLLDDGWFGNGETARNNSHAGLGDWDVNHAKLPNGIPGLVSEAKNAGVKFGIWIEPEMVNPESELFQKHPDWAILQPNRKPYYYRNQLVLDMANPKVQDYVFSIVENIMKENPDIAAFKWDCNSTITNAYSPYLKADQGRLYIEHARGVQNVMARVAEKYPDVDIMLCSGGGGRCDYDSMKYFTEFWPSDDTDPLERCYIQWGFSQFFPAKTMCAHVTSWLRAASIKFRTDVASMCKLGFDIALKDLNNSEITFCQEAIRNWKRLTPSIMDGDQYRLISPYETNHMALNYVSKDKSQAVLFAYDIHPRIKEKLVNVRLQGLDPAALYKVEEINLMPGAQPSLPEHGKTFTGDYLMKIGLDVLTIYNVKSHVIELNKQ